MIDYETLYNLINEGFGEKGYFACNQYGFSWDGFTLKHCNKIVAEPERNYIALKTDVIFSHRLDLKTIFDVFQQFYQTVVICGPDENLVHIGYDYKSDTFVRNDDDARNDIYRPDGGVLQVPSWYFDKTVEQLRSDLVEEMPSKNGFSNVLLRRCKRCGHPYLVDWSYHKYLERKGWKIPFNCTKCREQIRRQKEDK